MRRSAALLAAGVIAALVASACGGATASPSPSPVSSALPSPSPAGPSPSPGGPEAVALAFLGALSTGDTAAAEAMEADQMRTAAPAATLDQLWDQLEAQFGAFRSLGEVSTADAAPFVNATVLTTFADAIVPLIVTVDADGKVAGLHLGAPAPLGSAAPSPSASPAAYVDPSAFTETEVTVGAPPWALPGTLSMPVGPGPVPGVVLLAGSGPNDRDETIGPNAPLRDLAWGLASSGIAVLRYDKRTRVYGPKMAANPSITVAEETVDDAVAAVELLRSTPGVDPARVLVVGHSLGAMLAPRIAAAAPGEVAGIGVLEGPGGSLAQAILAQYEYLASEAGGADAQAAAALPEIRKQVALVESASLSEATPASQLPLGIPAAYWLDLRTYDQVAVAAGLPIPIFISQGGRDYQVPPSELDRWRASLAGRDDVTIRAYPALNHLLIAGEGPSRPAEYTVPGHVAQELVADLAAWVKGNGG